MVHSLSEAYSVYPPVTISAVESTPDLLNIHSCYYPLAPSGQYRAMVDWLTTPPPLLALPPPHSPLWLQAQSILEYAM